MKREEGFDLPVPGSISSELAKAYAAQFGAQPKEEHYVYREYLSDSRELIQRIASFVGNSHGKRMLLSAPCGSGKTCVMLTQIAGLSACRRMILLVPNSIQAQQNARFVCTREDGSAVHPVPVTAETKQQDFGTEDGIPVSAVYDEAYKIALLREEELAKTLLVVDEAHLLYEAKSYRNDVIEDIHRVEKRILETGGNVIYMSGTVRKILWHGYDLILYADHVGDAGKKIPAIRAEKVVVHYKDSRHGNLLSEIVSVIRNLVGKGYRPIVRINSRNLIRSVKENLSGLDVRYLTADEKGFVLCEDPESSAHCVRVYDNEVYGNLQQHAVIPAADVYLVTSVVEVGTSIDGVIGPDGKRLTSPRLRPVFAVLNRSTFNADQFIQFCSRPRFSMDAVDLVLNRDEKRKEKDPGERLSVERIAGNLYHDCSLFAERASRTAPCRADLRDWTDRIENQCTFLDESGTRRVSLEEILAASWEEYDRMAASYERVFPSALERLTGGIPVELETDHAVPCAKAEKIKVSEELRSAAYRASESPEFHKTFLQKNGADLTSKSVQEMKKMENGILLLGKIHEVLAAMGERFGGRESVDAALWLLEHPSDPFVLEDGTTIRNLSAELTGRMIQSFADLDPVRREYLCLHYFHVSTGADSTDRAVRGLLFLPEKLRLQYGLVFSDARFQTAMELYRSGSEMGTGYSWRTIFLQASQHSASWMRRLQHSQDAAWFNTMNPGTPEYRKSVMRDASVYGAQYDLIRTANHGKGFVYPDPDGVERAHFAEGFQNRTIRQNMLEKLAGIFNEEVRKNTKRRDFARTYSAEKIREMLWDIYVCTPVKTGDEKDRAFLVRSLRKRPRMRKEEAGNLREEAIAVTEHFVKESCDLKFLKKELTFDACLGQRAGLPQRQLLQMNRELLRTREEEGLLYGSGAVRLYYDFMAEHPREKVPRLETILAALGEAGKIQQAKEIQQDSTAEVRQVLMHRKPEGEGNEGAEATEGTCA